MKRITNTYIHIHTVTRTFDLSLTQTHTQPNFLTDERTNTQRERKSILKLFVLVFVENRDGN